MKTKKKPGKTPISILLTNRNTLEFLKLAIKSIRENATNKNHELIIMDDNSTDGSKEWLKQNRNKYAYSYHTHDQPERKGIVNIVEEGVKKCSEKIIFIGHSDMYYAKNFDKNLLKWLKPKTIITSTRIEPPLHPQEKCKITKNFGKFPEEFQEKEFKTYTEKIMEKMKDSKTDGVFAPNLLYKKDWIGYDKNFSPQSREDDDMFYTMKEKGYEFIQSWDSLVYHFTSRGSRYKNNKLEDSKEWQETNNKNTKNFIRKWGTIPLHTQTKHPIIAPKIKLSATVLCKNEGDKIYQFLSLMEPYFNEIIIVDDNSTDNSLAEIDRYKKDTLRKGPTNFNPDKIKIYNRSLNQDFATQTNYAVSKCSNEWVMKFDPDELMDSRSLSNMRILISSILKENPSVEVIGIPRLNTLNGVLVNDTPRNKWTKEYLNKQKKFNPKDSLNLKNPDYQFRFHKKNVKWVNPVHETPLPVKNQEKDKVVITHNISMLHPKTLKKQKEQNEFYQKINKQKNRGELKNIVVNSVCYTWEGITKHAREEMKQLKKKGYNIFLTTQPYQSGFDPEMKKMYDVFDTKKPHINYVNQPPIRQNNPFHSILGNLNKENLVAYLSFEGIIPNEWAKVLSHENIKKIFVPSQYVKKCFEKSGVKPTNKIRIIPHGINPEQIKETKPHNFKKFTFLWAGTTHNPRKGYDLAVKAFSEEFGNEKDVQLVIKTNKIYDPKQNINREIMKYVAEKGNKNIKIIDDDLTDKEMYSLIKGANVYVSPHRSEGFGIIILESLALSTPVIATKASGNLDFCNEKNTLFINVKKEQAWAPYHHPYERTKWYQPKLSSLKKQMRESYNNYERIKERSMKESEKILKEWTWKKTGELMKKEFDQL